MRRKREVIKNIKPVFCRFDMDNEQERRAWQIIQKLNKGQEEDRKLSYNNIISQAITGYYDKVTMSHEELLEKVKEVIHSEVTTVLRMPLQMPYSSPQNAQVDFEYEELNEAALSFLDGISGI
ncbi:hypothetical protein D3Z60_19720 [Lachnospiraceae bacterium]|jgi:hypothetical protein|nr:hypothetical protein [Lachnospiraceae bacterium]